MLTVLEAIQQRRSVRKFLSDDVPDEAVRQLLEAARLAPSGSNAQPWRFIVVKDAEVRKELSALCHSQRQVTQAPVAVVCLANLDRYTKEARGNSYRELTRMGIAQDLTGRLAETAYWEQLAANWDNRRERVLLHAVANTFIAIEHILLTATALGLGTCWLGAVDNPDIQKLFGLPENLVSVAVVAIGHRAGDNPPARPRLSMEEMVQKPQIGDRETREVTNAESGECAKRLHHAGLI